MACQSRLRSSGPLFEEERTAGVDQKYVTSESISCRPSEDENVPAQQDDRLVAPQVIRAFQPGDLDLDDLAAAICRLLDSGDAAVSDTMMPAESALLSLSNRVSHVMESRGANPRKH